MINEFVRRDLEFTSNRATDVGLVAIREFTGLLQKTTHQSEYSVVVDPIKSSNLLQLEYSGIVMAVKLRHVVLLVVTLLACSLDSTALAQYGPILSGAGPVNRSMGGVSTAAPVSAAGALMWNPASLAGLTQSELEIGAEFLLPHTSLSSSIPANTFGAAAPPVDLAGKTENQDSIFALPTMALAYSPEGSSVTYGLGVLAAAGFGLDYEGSATNPLLTAPAPNGVGFGPVYSEYQVIQVVPSVVLDVTDQVSVSMSPLINLGTLQFDPAVFAAPDDANGDGFATYPPGVHSKSAWGAGFSVGAFYDGAVWNFGASYKSEQFFEPYQFNTSDELGRPRPADFELNLPAIISVGASYEGVDNLLLAVDIRYLDFSNADGFGDSGFSPTGAIRGVGFESSVAVAVGAQYHVNESLTMRLGYSWSDNPIPDAQTSANLASPVIIEHMFSMGATYNVTDAFSLSIGYTRGIENSISGPIVLPTGPASGTNVRSSAAVDMFLLGATVKFGRRSSGCGEYR